MFELLKPSRVAVGKRIRVIKDELGVSLTELGNRLELIKPTINSYIQGYSLAPLEVIEKLSKISGKKVGWFYFGEIEDYLCDYLRLKGYGDILVDYPELPSEMRKDLLTSKFKNQAWENEFGFPKEAFLDDYFKTVYDDIMRKHITSMTHEFLTAKTNHTDSQIEEMVILISADVYNAISVVGHLDYQDKDQILTLVENFYDNTIKDDTISFADDYLVGKLINILNDDTQTIDLIHELSHSLTDKQFTGFFGGQELVEAFQAMRPTLIKIYADHLDDDFHDWFVK